MCEQCILLNKFEFHHFRYDSCKGMESLDTVWVSRANALQRRGRAGRVASGVCFHLFTRHRFDYHLQEQPIPGHCLHIEFSSYCRPKFFSDIWSNSLKTFYMTIKLISRFSQYHVIVFTLDLQHSYVILLIHVYDIMGVKLFMLQVTTCAKFQMLCDR